VQHVVERRAVGGEDPTDDLEDAFGLRGDVAGRHHPAVVVDGDLAGEHEQRSAVEVEARDVGEAVAERRADARRVVEG
jgi:hypothetical protein